MANCSMIGIMQGRLLPSPDGRIQGFPLHDWQEEFAYARQVGLSFIEWIYENPNCANNPIGSTTGLQSINSVIKKQYVAVKSVCADYFMENRLISNLGLVQQNEVVVLEWLISMAHQISAQALVLPFVDSSSLATKKERLALVGLLNDLEQVQNQSDIEIHLELDIEPDEMTYLLGKIKNTKVKIVFDIGNSASLGYDPTEELRCIGDRLGSIHVKDRLLGGGTVPLGKGNADFGTIFECLDRGGYDGWFTFQAARVPGISERELASQNLQFIKGFLSDDNPY